MRLKTKIDLLLMIELKIRQQVAEEAIMMTLFYLDFVHVGFNTVKSSGCASWTIRDGTEYGDWACVVLI